jgi:protein required for attachment to host cells
MSVSTWVMVADAGRARVFESAGAGQPLREVAGFVHERSRVKRRDILTDRPGRVRPGTIFGPDATAMPPHTDPKETEAARFAHDLAEEMRRARDRDGYEHLVVVAPPHFLGLLRASLHGQLGKCHISTIDGDYTLLAEPDLRSRLAEALGDVQRRQMERSMS